MQQQDEVANSLSNDLLSNFIISLTNVHSLCAKNQCHNFDI